MGLGLSRNCQLTHLPISIFPVFQKPSCVSCKKATTSTFGHSSIKKGGDKCKCKQPKLSELGFKDKLPIIGAGVEMIYPHPAYKFLHALLDVCLALQSKFRVSHFRFRVEMRKGFYGLALLGLL